MVEPLKKALTLEYPKLPITFVQEHELQIRLALGYCQDPSKYEGEYAKLYEKYVQSHKKTLIKKAIKMNLKEVLVEM